jgi:ribosomal-protein-alanine N-acetyltransferase
MKPGAPGVPVGPILVRRMRAEDLQRVFMIARSRKHAPLWPRTAYLAALDPRSTPRRIALVAEGAAEGPVDAERLVGLKGHGFSRAEERPETILALAAEGLQAEESTFPQGLKPETSFAQPAAQHPESTQPRPFRTDNFTAPGKSSPANGEAESGRVVGFLIASLLPPQAELESIAVSAKQQRRGIGRLLLAAMVEELKAAGVRQLILEVRASSQRALGFYRSLGWSETGRRPRYYADPEEDAVLMTLELG